MLTDFSKKDPRVIGGCIHGLGLVITCGAVLIMLNFIIRPLQQEISQQQRQSKAVNSFLDKSESINNRNEQLTQDLKEAQQRWNHTLKQIPATPQESAYLAVLTKQIDQSNLNMDDFSLGGMHDHETIKERDLTLSLTGNFTNLCHFLNKLNHLPRITNVQQLKVTPPDPRRPEEDYLINLKLRMAFDYQEAVDENKTL